MMQPLLEKQLETTPRAGGVNDTDTSAGQPAYGRIGSRRKRYPCPAPLLQPLGLESAAQHESKLPGSKFGESRRPGG